ncbi:nitrate- and nitrite sensing domain-containing protein [Lentzea sp. BCCO 10_0061]|uniref:histidine kinase n=1 Tax=Lentzea sokolovensis TaxID=3095429 RepID=A0ABU4V5F8_9PSEU|nr:nitrate- and nitrite sensing domain-containing protein [Lentzea sp. BCCO 10_0061]MDX8147028.1 nitrate- and nitrite sensing domain-containing protein [Lentzea sp. BCCO 10_0061]
MNEKSGYTPTNYRTIRSRLAGVVVVPSVVLLVMWAVFSSYTLFDGFYMRSVATGVKGATIPSVEALAGLQKERQLTLEVLSGVGGVDKAGLKRQQGVTDEAVRKMKDAFAELSSSAPQDTVDRINALDSVLNELPQQRTRIDSGSANPQAVYDYYNSLLDSGVALLARQARLVPDSEASQANVQAVTIFQAADWLSRGATIGSRGLLNGRFTAAERVEFARLVGAYHSGLDATIPFALEQPRSLYDALRGSTEYRSLLDLEGRIINSDATVTDEQWRGAAAPVHDNLVGLAVTQARDAADLGLDKANSRVAAVLIGSLIALLAVVVGIVLALRISNRLVSRALVTRLASLREDTLRLAQERLPHIVARLRGGEQVDVHRDMPPLDYGNDEIGQVADAFNAAQYTAVAAAVKETQAREGVNRVFLDIAHRNQGLVHRQIKILDKLEREEEHPERLDSLFQLDHLATRARRNAENLIILAGEQPGRQWRKPVRLSDVLRSAVAETEQYVRVRVNPVPDRALVGVAVADTIHLLAELVDNATAFSSPRSEVIVHSNAVPHGIVIEIEDHGLGMTQEERLQANAKLSNPPDFETMAFRGESRLGLFVVARLAARRGIKVELRDSPYGGTVALCVLPPNIVAPHNAAGDITETTQMPVQSFHDTYHGHGADHPSFPVKVNPEVQKALNAGLRALVEPDMSPVAPAAVSAAEASVEEPTPAAPPAQDGKAPLPRRKKRQNLAPQLMQSSEEPPPAEPVTGERLAERSRDGLAAFQRGTRDARLTDDWRSEGAPSS